MSNKTFSNPTDDLLMKNVEALASSETIIIPEGGTVVIPDAKNRWGGLVAGCKAKKDDYCTVKGGGITITITIDD